MFTNSFDRASSIDRTSMYLFQRTQREKPISPRVRFLQKQKEDQPKASKSIRKINQFRMVAAPNRNTPMRHIERAVPAGFDVVSGHIDDGDFGGWQRLLGKARGCKEFGESLVERFKVFAFGGCGDVDFTY